MSIDQTSRFDNVNTIYGGKVFGPGASGVIRQTSRFDNERLVLVPVTAYRLFADGGAYTYSGSKAVFLRGGGDCVVWLPVDDNQGANWQNVSDAQTPGWVLVDDSQKPGCFS